MIGCLRVQHRRVKAGMHEQRAVVMQPAGRRSDLDRHPLAQTGVELCERGEQRRLAAHLLPGDRARQLQIVIAQQEQAAAVIDQAEHDAQRLGVVRPVVGKVAKLHDEAVGGRGVAKRDGIAVHVADHADRHARRDGSNGHFAAACGVISRSATSPARS